MEKPTEEELTNQHFGDKYWELVCMLGNANMNDFKRLTKWAKNFMQRMEGDNDTGTKGTEEKVLTEPSRIITLD